jgi:hypothetical protein
LAAHISPHSSPTRLDTPASKPKNPPTADLKPSLSRHLNKILQPVRDHFVNSPEAAALLKQVGAF